MADYIPEWARGLLPNMAPQSPSSVIPYQSGNVSPYLRTIQGGGLLGGPAVQSTAVTPGMKEVVGERVIPKLAAPAKAATKAAAKGAGSGLLGRLGAAAFGPAGMLVQGVLTPGELDDPNQDPNFAAQQKAYQNLDKTMVGRMDEVTPGTYAAGIADRAVDRGMSGAMQVPQGVKDEYARGEHPLFKGLPQQQAQPKQPKPQSPQQVPQQSPQIETARQQVEANAKEKLRTNQLSRPKAAEEVVKAELARTGQTATPEEVKDRVKEETAAMKNMDDDQLSRYLSYALIAGGLIAAATDKSGAAGAAFGGAFLNELQATRQARAKQKELDLKTAKEEREAANADRRMDIQETDVESKVKNRETLAGQGAERLGLSRDELEAKRAKWDRDAASADAKLSAYIKRSEAIGSGKKAPRAVELSQADAVGLAQVLHERTGAPPLKDEDAAVVGREMRRLATQYPTLPPDSLYKAAVGYSKGNQTYPGTVRLQTKDNMILPNRTIIAP